MNEPYREQEVIEAARTLQPPFLLREMIVATGLPRTVVHRVLGRLVKKGIFTRSKARISVDGGRYSKPCYLYSWAEPE